MGMSLTGDKAITASMGKAGDESNWGQVYHGKGWGQVYNTLDVVYLSLLV